MQADSLVRVGRRRWCQDNTHLTRAFVTARCDKHMTTLTDKRDIAAQATLHRRQGKSHPTKDGSDPGLLEPLHSLMHRPLGQAHSCKGCLWPHASSRRATAHPLTKPPHFASSQVCHDNMRPHSFRRPGVNTRAHVFVLHSNSCERAYLGTCFPRSMNDLRKESSTSSKTAASTQPAGSEARPS